MAGIASPPPSAAPRRGAISRANNRCRRRAAPR
jgi:hypothetical protein